MDIIGIIPARYASTRFPGKPLADIGGKTMIQRVIEQCKKSEVLKKVIVATDDERIFNHVKELGHDVYMTSADHKNGTERCHEALKLEGGSYDFVINIQGDEPFIEPEQIKLLASILDRKTEIATLIKCIDHLDDLQNPNIIKALKADSGLALYFSRSPIPHMRNIPTEDWMKSHQHYKHIGMYAYRVDILARLVTLSPTPLEIAESLEQLRWIENGYRIKTAITPIETIGIDTPEDLEKAMKEMPL
ncbi:3-deoxy-manno-octulosonate cytidylyltransferase [Marivirga arenosa]|uniref:3-deoxy-manno-octulosonate cytidylyltransferase n=1 Tax=Marivirga arenosa TaxID=3059076 RepID=A0AA51ZVG6_9BACT|nr:MULTISPECIES: 3-deoxy-manno-octulosonate cytidylyltransferase [unclassified Marivirga]WMN06183.1 3-deoxy-manno-octulosonate cytidylyltransferase [Marivirga sp. ABR2-2]WNB17494.1 3-deoxy-manno-octulosonate cytidylyltransferase [Marivirga sp. BKB1-2]